MQSRILGTGHYLPKHIVTNGDLSEIVDTSDEWIFTRSGIKERRISTGENTSDLGLEAAKEALQNAGITAEELDLIIVATITPDSFMPSVACILQAKLGAVKAACFDITAACSGFIYALSIANQFIVSGQYKNILVVGAEVISKILDWKDRSTCVLFGDGAGAAVLGASEDKGIKSINLGADGTKAQALRAQAVPVHNPFVSYDEVIDIKNDNFIYMEGREVFKFATNIIVETVEKLLEDNLLKKDDIKYIVPHQANIRIIDFASKKLGISSDKFYTNLSVYGNTSAASIPIALDELNRSGLLQRGDKIILVGFGGGLTYGSALLEW